MRVYFDTEFTDLRHDAELISAGFVSEHGHEFYAEITEFRRLLCSEFVDKTVLPLLDAPEEMRMKRNEFVIKVTDWLKELDDEIILISDSTWDSMILRPLFVPAGGIHALVPGLKYRLAGGWDETGWKSYQQGYEDYFKSNPGKQHHALHDARALKAGCLRVEGCY